MWGLEKFQCTHYLLLIEERWCKTTDKGGETAFVLIVLSKTFDCLGHKLLIANLNAYGFLQIQSKPKQPSNQMITKSLIITLRFTNSLTKILSIMQQIQHYLQKNKSAASTENRLGELEIAVAKYGNHPNFIVITKKMERPGNLTFGSTSFRMN